MRLAVIGFLILSSVAAAQGQTNMRAVSIDVTTGYLFTSNMTNVATTGRWNGDGGGWTNLNLAGVTNDLTNLTVRVDALESDMADVQSATDEFWLAYSYGTNWNVSVAHGITAGMTQTWSQAGVDAGVGTNYIGTNTLNQQMADVREQTNRYEQGAVNATNTLQGSTWLCKWIADTNWLFIVSPAGSYTNLIAETYGSWTGAIKRAGY